MLTYRDKWNHTKTTNGMNRTSLSFVSHGRSLVRVREAFLGDGDDNIVMRSLQEHLPLKIDQTAFFGAFQSPDQGFVVLLDVIVVEPNLYLSL